ncbi:hypothetical protein DSECCO2_79780 [anaerobic digester metagenome]|jgi:hypothetical protein
MKTISSLISTNQTNEMILSTNQLSIIKGGGDSSTHDGEIIDRDKPIYIKE